MKEKVKKFWEEFKQHWLWINIGGYMGITMMNWLGYFLGFISLEITLIFTFILPPILISIYYTRKSRYQRSIYKIVWVVGGGVSLGWVIWVSIGYTLVGAPWAPLHESRGIMREITLILPMVPSYCLAAYIMYRLGKKRDFRPFM